MTMNRVQRILDKATRLQMRHPRWFLGVALGLTAISILYTVAKLEFQTSQRDLLSEKDRLVQLSAQMDVFDVLDTFVVAIENQNDRRSLAFLRALAGRLEADGNSYQQVFYRVDPEAFKPWALLYLDRGELLDLSRRLQDHRGLIRGLGRAPDLARLFGDINREMASGMVGQLFTGFLDENPGGKEGEPGLNLDFLIGILEKMRDGLDGKTGSLGGLWGSFLNSKSWDDVSEEGYFWTENRKYLLLLVTPRKMDDGFSNTLRSLNALRAEIAGLKADHPGIRAGVTGMEALNEDEMGLALTDMSEATILSFAGLVALLLVFWRGCRRALLELVQLLVALAVTLGLTTLFIGHLNILSVTFAPMLLGMGIDYGIHWFSRYQEEEGQGSVTKEQAIREIMIKLGPGILLAGVTAALSFFPLVLTGFKGLVELGLITAMGLFICTLTTLFLLPSLVLLFDRFKPAGSPSSRGIALLSMDRWKAVVILIPAGAALGFSVWGGAGVKFDLNMLHLQSRNAESVIWERRLLEGSERSSMYGAVLAGSIQEVKEKADALRKLSTASDVQSVLGLLPGDQEEKIRILRGMKPVLDEAGPLSIPAEPVDLSALDRALGAIRFKMAETDLNESGRVGIQMERVRELIDEVRKRFPALDRALLVDRLNRFQGVLFQDLREKLEFLKKGVDARPMSVADLPSAPRQRFVSDDDRYLIRVFPALDVWEPGPLGRFVQDLRSVDPDAIGDPVTLYVFTREFRNASIKAAVYAFAMILAVLLITFRSIPKAMVVLSPLVVGTVWTIGMMRLFGVDFNLANSIFLPLVLGAGAEYGIIILQRLRQQPGTVEGIVLLPWSTVKGVVLAGLTTTVGFGSLAISSHQGIHSLGLLAMAGSLCVLAAALLFMPALLQVLPWLYRRK